MNKLGKYFSNRHKLCGRSYSIYDKVSQVSCKHGILYDVKSDYTICAEDVEENLIMAYMDTVLKGKDLKTYYEEEYEITHEYFKNIIRTMMVYGKSEILDLIDLFKLTKLTFSSKKTNGDICDVNLIINYPTIGFRENSIELTCNTSIYRMRIDTENMIIIRTEKVSSEYKGVDTIDRL